MPRLIYKGDTTDNFGRYLPTPIIETIKIINAQATDPFVATALDAYTATRVLGITSAPTIDIDNLSKITIETSTLFNSDDEFSTEDLMQELFGYENGNDCLYLNVFVVKDKSKIDLMKADKMQISILRDLVAMNSIFLTAAGTEALSPDRTIISEYAQVYSSPVYQVYSIPYSDFATSISFTPDFDDEGNAVVKTSYTTYDIYINGFKSLDALSVFATISTNAIGDMASMSKAAFAMNFGDISYEDVKINGIVATFGDPVFLDANSQFYPDTPLQTLDSKYHKTEAMDHAEIIRLISTDLADAKPLAEKDKILRKQIDNIDYVLASFAGDVQLLAQLNKANRLSNKNPNTNTGRLHVRMSSMINAINSNLLGSDEVVKRIYRNNKILDLRTVEELVFDPSYQAELESPSDNPEFIYPSIFHTNVAKYVPVAEVTDWPGRAELPSNSQQRTEQFDAAIQDLKDQLKSIFESVASQSTGLTPGFVDTEDIFFHSVIAQAAGWVSTFDNLWASHDTAAGDVDPAPRKTTYVSKDAWFEDLNNDSLYKKVSTTKQLGNLAEWLTTDPLQIIFPRPHNGTDFGASSYIESAFEHHGPEEQRSAMNNVIGHIQPFSSVGYAPTNGTIERVTVYSAGKSQTDFFNEILAVVRSHLETSDFRSESFIDRVQTAAAAVTAALVEDVDAVISGITNPLASAIYSTEDARDHVAKTTYDSFIDRFLEIFNGNAALSPELWTMFIAANYRPVSEDWGEMARGRDLGRCEIKFVPNETEGVDDTKGIIRGHWPNAKKIFPNQTEFVFQVDLIAPVRDSILHYIKEREEDIRNIIETIIENATAYNSFEIDAGLHDALAEVDIIIKKSGYFFFDIEKYIRKRSFISRYINVDKLLNFLPEAQEMTNNAIHVEQAIFDNKSYTTKMVLKNEINPYIPSEFNTLEFNTINLAGGTPAAYKKAPILTSQFTFNELLRVPREQDLPRARTTTDEYSFLVQRNFNFTGFGDSVLYEGKTWHNNYRLCLYNYQFFIDDDYYNLGAPADERNSTDNIEIEIILEDKSKDMLDALIDAYLIAYSEFDSEYCQYALEQCSYDEYNLKFNNFFVEEMLRRYPDSNNPWTRMVALYTLYINMFTDFFEGNYETMLDSADKIHNMIRPETGILSSLISFKTQAKKLYDELKNIKSAAKADSITFHEKQSFTLTKEIKKPVLDHIGNYRAIEGTFVTRGDHTS